LDATHVTFGVVTTGIAAAKWKAEVSAFNGREPDEQRTGFDFAALDSVAARVSYSPIPALAFQVSGGKLVEAEAGEHGVGPRVDVTRTTASAIIHTGLDTGRFWATTLAWGRNTEEGRSRNALLVESSLTLRERHTWFSRFETARKSAHDLDLPLHDEEFTVAKVQSGYARTLPAHGGVSPGFGGALSASIVPEALRAAYRKRVNLGVAFFVTLRPARAMMKGQ
jgi:hypothetical protein